MDGRLESQEKIYTQINNLLKDLPKYVEDWYLMLRASNKTAATCQTYIRTVRQFLLSIDEKCDVELSQITQDVVMKYFISIQTKQTNDGRTIKTSDSYRCGVHSCLSSFFRFLFKSGSIPCNYMDMIDRPKNQDLERINEHRVLLTTEDFQDIINTIKKGVPGQKYEGIRGMLRERDLSMMLLLMFTGIRRTALVNINLEDVNLITHTLSVVDKGAKRRVCALSSEVVDTLNVWLQDREEILNILGKTSDALFINYEGNRLSSKSVAEMCHRYTKYALGESISPHKLRAGFCSILYNETHDLEFVRRAVGHSDISTTQRYVVTDNQESLKANMIMEGKLKV